MDEVQDSLNPATTVQNLPRYYELSVESTGVYITIFPPQGTGETIAAKVIYDELIAKGLHTVKEEVIYRATQQAGKQILVGEYPGPEEPEINIDIAKNKMEAQLTLIPSRKNDLPPVETIKGALAEHGIIFGIDEEQISRALKNPKQHVVVATGTQPENGLDAYLEHAFDFSMIGKPKAHMDGSVNFHDLGMVFNVRAEDIIAQKIYKTEGITGSNIMGEAILPKPGKDIPSPAGKNVCMDEHGRIRALIDGQIQVINGKINVSPVFEVREDVDVSTGNIEFIGTVVVRGSVQTGFAIKADGDIEIYGTVSGASLDGKNIVVKSGIQGMQRGIIRARGNLIAKFIENANVIAQDTVTVAEAILHSTVSAGKRVIVNGKKAIIVGGVIRAGEEIQTRLVGSHLATPTTLEVGVNPELRDEFVKNKKELKAVDHQLDQTKKAMHLLKNMEANGSITPDKKDMLLKVTKSYYNLAGQNETLRKRVSDIETQMEELKYGKIKVSEIIHPGVKIVIGSAILPVRDKMTFVTLYGEDGDVKIGPFN